MRALAPFTDTVYMARTIPHRVIVSTLTSCCSILTPRPSSEISNWNPALFGYRIESGDDLSFDDRDSAPFMPRCRVIDPAFTWGQDRFPTPGMEPDHHLRDARPPVTPSCIRWSPKHCAAPSGIDEPAVLDHFRYIGVTAVELMPVHAFVNDSYLLDKGLTNYWGYNSISFFAPVGTTHPCLIPSANSRKWWPGFMMPASRSFSTLSTTIPRKVIISVRRLSFKGIDNASYYRLIPDEPRYYINDTGTGNTLIFRIPAYCRWSPTRLRYWVQEMHVDGFRWI